MNINHSRAWLFTALGLVAVAAAGGAALGIRLNQVLPVEISLTREDYTRPPPGIYIEGRVAHPGFYSTPENATLAALLDQAGIEADADREGLRLIVPGTADNATPQKIDLNRAEGWLLASLPGIGDVRARAILDYRAEHGPFRQASDLLNVPGISPAVLERLRPFVTPG